MQQPYPMAAGETLDFTFDATEILELGDTITSYTLSPSSTIFVSNDTEVSGYVTFFASWLGATAVGTSGLVDCTVHSSQGRVLTQRLELFLSEPV